MTGARRCAHAAGRLAALPGALLLLWALPLHAQNPARTDSSRVAPGPRYAAGALHRFLFGSDYRDLWTTPLQVAVLDLATFAGGLQPLQRGGGFQTKSLRFAGANGREYAFRSIDKDPSSILPPALRETLVDRLVQDQISAGHPVGALVVAPILEAVGVLHAEPLLVRMPDDPRLGEFRAEFAGMLGFLEERPDENDDAMASFAGASNVVGTERMLEGIEEELEVVDARAFLAARLVDIFLGDWDRHRDQWRWARFGSARTDAWQPIPRDRDQAFVRLDGAMLSLARQYYPQLVKFDASYPNLIGVTWNGRELDRRLLVALERPAWDSVAARLVTQLTDAVLERAVHSLPGEYRDVHGPTLLARLRARRDALPVMAADLYALLASEVDVHTTDAPEHVDLTHDRDALHVRVVAHDGRYGDVEVFRRTFLRSETKEVRLDLHGGADTVQTSGRPSGIRVRVVGGGGDDHLTDAAGGATLYGEAGEDTFVKGAGTRVDTRDWSPPETPPSQPPRDWGAQFRYPLWMRYKPDVGLLAGIGVEWYDYGFRTLPWSARLKVRGAWATGAKTYRVEAEYRRNRENSRNAWLVAARASGLDILNFHGFGNESVIEGDEAQYEVEQSIVRVAPQYVLAPSARTTVRLGPTLTRAHSELDSTRLLGRQRPYGAGDFTAAALSADLDVDGRDRARTPTRGARLLAGGSVWPAWLDVDETFTEVHGTAAAWFSPFAPMQPTLALRIGAKALFGRYPFHEAAYIGDEATVRLGRDQRYAGDVFAHANAELRTRIGRVLLVVPADVGVFALADVGRVWYEGEDSNEWHDALGGGVWLGFLGAENAISVAVAKSEERTGVYVSAGFAW